jgi:hypothetical protein
LFLLLGGHVLAGKLVEDFDPNIRGIFVGKIKPGIMQGQFALLLVRPMALDAVAFQK